MPSITNTHRMIEVMFSSKKKVGLTERKIPKAINATATEIESTVLSVRLSMTGGLFWDVSGILVLRLVAVVFFKVGSSLYLRP